MKRYQSISTTSPARKQAGVVMVTSIIFLIVLSVLTIMALRRSLFEEKMAGNDRDTYYAREAAELALRDAERDIAGQRFDGTYCSAAIKATCGGNLRMVGHRPVDATDAASFWSAASSTLSDFGSPTVSSAARPASVDNTMIGWYDGKLATEACGKPLWQAADWDVTQSAAQKCTDTTSVVRTTIYGEFTGAPTANLFAPNQRLPRYLVEVFDASSMGISSSRKVFLRITAVGFGRLGNFAGNTTSVTLQSTTSVTLQSIYSPN